MPQHAYGFYAPVTYLMKYAFTFTLRHRNSPPSAYIGVRVQPIAAARGTRRTDGRTDTGLHFIMVGAFHIMPLWSGHNNIHICIPPWVVSSDAEIGGRPIQ